MHPRCALRWCTLATRRLVCPPHALPTGARWTSTHYRSTTIHHLRSQLPLSSPTPPLTLSGWLCAVRDIGGLVFLTLRDGTGGTLQLRVGGGSNDDPELVARAAKLLPESAITVTGVAVPRAPPRGSSDPLSGVEVEVTELTLHSHCAPVGGGGALPFSPFPPPAPRPRRRRRGCSGGCWTYAAPPCAPSSSCGGGSATRSVAT